MTRSAPSCSRPAHSQYLLIGALCLVWIGLTSISPAGAQSLTLRQRIEGTERLEQVYWSHRTWPAENTRPKPRLADVLPLELLGRRAEDAVRMTNALRALYQVSLDDAELQSEMNRIGRETRLPSVLRELFAALDNDPKLIAECLVRPLVAERRLRELFEHRHPGSSFEGWWEQERANHSPALQLDFEAPTHSLNLPTPDGTDAPCTDDTWLGTMQIEPQGRRDHVAVWTGSEMLVWDGADGSLTARMGGGRYNPATNSWQPIFASANPSLPSSRRTAVWSGTEMILWGGGMTVPGERYNPTTSNWSSVSSIDAPMRVSGQSAVWTGTRMLVWGGYVDSIGAVSTGASYDPVSDLWTVINPAGAPQERADHLAAWTGTEMIIWGETSPASGGAYRPSTNTWRSLPNPPELRWDASAVWTGSRFFVWGGTSEDGSGDTTYPVYGLLYNPTTNAWSTTGQPGIATANRTRPTIVWSGSEALIFGGTDFSSGGGPVSDGVRYRPSNDSYSAMTPTGEPSARDHHTAVWTGSEMIVWGGAYDRQSTGARYNPVTDTWTPTFSSGAPSWRTEAVSVWTGAEFVVWGGPGQSTGGRWDPATNTWRNTSPANTPTPRVNPSVVWTGTEMIIWGGSDTGSFVRRGDGKRYNPTSDTWLSVNDSGAPAARDEHSSVWTGTEMIVWGGGTQFDGALNDGGRYNPATNSWGTPPATSGAPLIRFAHTAVWTGSRMLIWGGWDGGGSYPPGGSYDPATNSWSSISTTNEPPRRWNHSAVWTGTKMIVFGGTPHGVALNTGGMFDPATNSWQATSTVGAPEPRVDHTAVWTGSRMLIWGGYYFDLSFTREDGARFDPTTNSWTPITQYGAPSRRRNQASAWTGNEMLIFSGATTFGVWSRDGARYCSAACTAVTWYRDVDGDGVGVASDTQSSCTQPPGYVAASGDCNDSSNQVWGTPGETRSLVLAKSAGTVTINWSVPASPGGTAAATRYDTLRSPNAANFSSAAICLETDGNDLASSDATKPAIGGLLAYLSRAGNSCAGGEGTLGSASNGAARAGRSCP